MKPPSRTLKKYLAKATGERDFIIGVEKDIEIAQSVKQGMDTVFGAALFNALEDLERAAFSEMSETSPIRIFKQIQIRSELRTARYIKARLQQYITNMDAMLENIKILNGEEIG